MLYLNVGVFGSKIIGYVYLKVDKLYIVCGLRFGYWFIVDRYI